MYEKLDKLRDEVRRCEKRAADAQNRLRAAQEKLKEGEASQILSDVGAMKLTPEELAQVLSLVKAGALNGVQSATEEKKDDSYLVSDFKEDISETTDEVKEENEDEEY